MELKIKDTDPNTGDILYEPVTVTVQKKHIQGTGAVSWIFDDIEPPPNGPSNNGFCGMSANQVKKMQNVIDNISEGNTVTVQLIQKVSNGAFGYRNVAKLAPVGIDGEAVVTPQPPAPVVTNTRTMGRVPPAWEMGVDYNNTKDNKICLNVACANAVTMFGHIAGLVGDNLEIKNEELAKKYDETYRLATNLIERLANLPIEKEEEEDFGEAA